MVPKTWPANPVYERPGNVKPIDADVKIDSTLATAGTRLTDNPFVRRYPICGIYNGYMRLTSAYMLEDQFIDTFGPRSKVSMKYEY